MVVKDLEAVFAKVKNKQMKVVVSSYCDAEINGWYIDTKDGEEVLVLTRLCVQPRNEE